MEGAPTNSGNESKNETPLTAEELKTLNDLIWEKGREQADEAQKELQERLDKYGTEMSPKTNK